MIRAISKTAKQFACAAALVLFAVSATAATLPQDCKNIQTDKGPLNGKLALKGAVCEYRGIPYAAPPVGELRFAQPKEHEPWTAPLDATKWGAKCPQSGMPMMSSNEPANESCLYLNIWQPITGEAPKPVMVFIHGGGFTLGSGAELFSSEKLAALGDVIAVTVNYRLGALGFISHPALRDAEGHTGNYGLLDQLAAIKWVKRNAASFGGDPDNIMIFGESAGGMSVGLQLASPLGKGQFNKASIQSGPALMVNMTQEAAEQVGIKAAEKLGCADLKTAAECLRKIPADTFVKSLPMALFFFANPGEENYYTGPVVDGYFLPDNPYLLFKNGKFNTDVKVILGTNSDEATLLTTSRKTATKEELAATINNDKILLREAFGINPYDRDFLAAYPVTAYKTPGDAYNDIICDVAFTCPTRILANLIVKWQPDVYLYYFSKAPATQPPFGKFGAYHSAELAFIFRKFSILGMSFETKENLAVSDKMIALWSSFARTGTPAAPDTPEWPKYETATEPYLHIDVKPVVEKQYRSERCKVLEENIKAGFEK
ncbi:MAG: carboxylesterase/lipase family protein [bacterium]